MKAGKFFPGAAPPAISLCSLRSRKFISSKLQINPMIHPKNLFLEQCYCTYFSKILEEKKNTKKFKIQFSSWSDLKLILKTFIHTCTTMSQYYYLFEAFTEYFIANIFTWLKLSFEYASWIWLLYELVLYEQVFRLPIA